MEVQARLKGIERNLLKKEVEFTFVTDSMDAAEQLERLQDKTLRVKAVRYVKKRSKSANALFWHCVGKIAAAVHTDKWDVYLAMLRSYGRYTYICVRDEREVEAVRRQWRESEIWGSVNIDGQQAIQMLCYYGSSSYNSKEMSDLIEGTISEMKALHLDPPLPQDVKVALEQWEEQYGKQHYTG